MKRTSGFVAVIWSLIERLSSQVISFLLGIVLARLLSPSDYGIVGMKVCQNAHLLFLCTKPRLSQAGALLLPKDFVSLSITFYTMTKIHFRPYNPNQTVLFPPRIDEDIAEHDPVRMVDALVESLNLESFRKLYKECGRSPYHPRMMLKVILYASYEQRLFLPEN